MRYVHALEGRRPAAPEAHTDDQAAHQSVLQGQAGVRPT